MIFDPKRQANDMYWVTQKLAAMSLEHASHDTDMEFVANQFDVLYEYIDKHKDDLNEVNGGLTFRMTDGRGISIGLCLKLVDEDDYGTS